MTAFEARTSTVRVAIQLAACLMFVGMGALMVIDGGVPAGWLVMAGFAIWFAIILPQLFRRRVELRVDVNGIWWRRWSDGTIPWSAIRQLRALEVENTRSIAIYLTDAAAPPSLRHRTGLADLAIRLDGTDRDFGDLLAAVREFAPPALLA